jgi:hypothetical protein
MLKRARATMSRTSLALSNLRAAVILIVLAFHSCIAYLDSVPSSAQPFNTPLINGGPFQSLIANDGSGLTSSARPRMFT